jgi:MerR family transcriptional regulator, mercuric resistance operon regulatory protein
MLPGREPITDIPAAAPTLRIGQLAKLASVHVETLRYYEREGLLDKPYQHLSGYRAYPVSAVAHVQSIKRAQALGFTLTEIRRLLKSSRGERVSNEASKKLAEIDATMADLQRARAELLRLVEYGCDRLVGCTCGQADCPTSTGVAEVPIACTLPPAAVGDRETEWRRLLDTSLVEAELIPSGVRITVEPGAAAELNRLIELERGCCAWMRFNFAAPETVAITAAGEGADVLAAMFLRREPSSRVTATP